MISGLGYNMKISLKLTKERKYILFIGVVLLVLGVGYRFYPTVSSFFSASDEIDFKKKNIEKYLHAVSARKHLEKKKNQLNRELDRLEEKLLTSHTPSLAAVEIQGMINEIAQANNVKVQTMQVLDAKDDSEIGYVAIPVKFSFNSNILQLKEIIYKIESPSKSLIIKELNVDTGSRSTPGEIRATMTVEGIMKGRLKEAEPPKKQDKKT
jgi:Tfp pilus assembly protein PilO